MIVGQANDLPVIMPVDEEARFTAEVTPWAGMFVKDADAGIMDDLEVARPALRAASPTSTTIRFCWRCDTPLIYYAKTSWYVRTTARKDDVLAANEEVTWYPDHLKHGRFGKWLENNIDWSLSRDRYWGTPLPVWRCAQRPRHRHRLARGAGRAGRRATSPASNSTAPTWTRSPSPARECGAEARRVTAVIDAWFDSGSMPVAQWHYPFENQEHVREALPGRLHLRGHRPDPRLVLQPARHQRAAHRPHLLQERALPGPHPRQRRPQDVQARWATWSTPGASSTSRAPTRCAGICSRVSSPWFAAPLRAREPGRGHPQVHAHPVEHLLVLHALRQHRRLRPGRARRARWPSAA